MLKLSKEQRQALKRLHERGRVDEEPVAVPGQRARAYRQFRRTVQPTIGCDEAVVVRWCGMWICIERDGYAHS
jgi:hypothetical protein